MKVVIQRVKQSCVKIDGKIVGEIGQGFVVLLGIMDSDTQVEADCLSAKVAGLRVFSDQEHKMNLSLLDVAGQVLLISNFTLGADCRKGKRPSFAKAAPPEIAQPLYAYFGEQLKANGVKKVEYGVFGADMEVSIVNDGPVTIIIDTNDLNVGGTSR